MKSHRKLWIAVVSTLIVLAWTLCALGQTTKPIGPSVWYQPASSHPKWKARGIQILYGYENEGDPSASKLDAWCATAKTNGLSYVLQDSAAAHWEDPECIGVFLTPDEPNGDGHKTPAEMKALSDAKRAKTKKPLWLSLNGGALVNEPDAEVAAYCASADVITFFSYAYNYGRGAAGVLGEIPPSLDKLRRCAPGKPIVFIGECSDQNKRIANWWKDQPIATSMRGPTADEMAFEYGVALAHGANGIAYFPDRIGVNWEAFDGTTPPCEVAMKNFNALYAPSAAAYMNAAGAAIQFDLTINGVKYVPAKP